RDCAGLRRPLGIEPPLRWCRRNKDPITPERLSSVRLLVLGRPNEPYTAEELEAIRVFVGAGGSLLALSGDGGDSRRGSNLNAVVSPYGLRFGADSVLRTAYHSSPYLHPKDCLITHPVVPASLEATIKRFVLRGAGKGAAAAAAASSAAGGGHAAEEEARRLDLRLAFPRGCTVEVATEDDADDDDDAIGGAASLAAVRRRRTAPTPVVLLTSGFVAYPVNQPIAAAFEAPHDPVAAAAMSSGPAASSASGSPSKSASRREGGRVVAAGSGDWMADKWLGKEHNSAVADAIVRWLLRDSSVSIAPEPSSEVSDRHLLPDITSLAESLRACLQESEPLPRDFTRLFDAKLFGLGSDPTVLKEVVAAYAKLDIKHDPLSLIAPHFETPLPDLEPAVFPPTLREPPPPALEQFDLDEQFASERLRLAQLTNKCAPSGAEDLDFFIREAGEIVGVSQELPPDRKEARHVLEAVLRAVVNFKKLNQDDGPSAPAGAPPATPGSSAKPSAMFPSSHLASPAAGSAGMGPGVAAGFRSSAMRAPGGL
ncbi:IFT52, partial [Symbiodinium sp. KB8]